MINSGFNAIMLNKIRVANIIPFSKKCAQVDVKYGFFVNLCPRRFIGLSGDFLSKKPSLIVVQTSKLQKITLSQCCQTKNVLLS